ncbi:MAG: pyridoxal phosphate-dependent decarboxylase family protein, partial [Gaiellaceae bacterium]
IPLDARRRMDPAECAAAIDSDRAAGIVPVAVVATAGTTLTGAVDPLAAIGEVARAHETWLHVDGAYGLPAAALPSMREVFAGLDAADSVTIDAHKWLYLPKACGVVLVRDPASLTAAFGHEETYFPHVETSTHSADQTLEYSRPFRALKVWLAFRLHGAEAFRAAIDRNLGHARRLWSLVEEASDFEGHRPPQLSVVPFRPRVEDAGEHAVRLAQALRSDGRVHVAHASIDGAHFLRPCFVNYRTSLEDVDALLAIVREVSATIR